MAFTAATSSVAITGTSPSVLGAGSTPPIGVSVLSPSFFGASARLGLSPNATCDLIAAWAPMTSSPVTLTSAIATAGTYQLCYSGNSGTSWVAQTRTMTVVTASGGSVTSLSPPIVVVGSSSGVTAIGATVTPTTQLMLSSTSGACLTGPTFNMYTGNSFSPVALGVGVYYLCFSVNNGSPWRAQNPAVTFNVISTNRR